MKESVIIKNSVNFGKALKFESGAVVVKEKELNKILKYKDSETGAYIIPKNIYEKLAFYLYVDSGDYLKVKEYLKNSIEDINSSILVSTKSHRIINNPDTSMYRFIQQVTV